MAMQIYRGLSEISQAQKNSVAAIGNYDGVHLGHQTILKNLQKSAPALPLSVITFEPSPREFFHPQQAPPRLTHLDDKLTRLKACGVDQTIILDFNAELAAMTADQFARKILIDTLAIHTLSVGEDYRYGANRQGNVHTLAAYPFKLLIQQNVLLTKENEVKKASELKQQKDAISINSDNEVDVMHAVDPVAPTTQRISSTRIRQSLLDGNFVQAEQMLGEPYWVSGKVVKGQQLGRTLGFPTLNIDLQGQRPPLNGVYAVEVEIEGAKYPAVANYGSRPSVDDGAPSLEVHVLNFSNDVYGAHCRVKFCSKIRAEQRFDGLAALQQQIKLDVIAAKAWFTDNVNQPK